MGFYHRPEKDNFRKRLHPSIQEIYDEHNIRADNHQDAMIAAEKRGDAKGRSLNAKALMAHNDARYNLCQSLMHGKDLNKSGYGELSHKADLASEAAGVHNYYNDPTPETSAHFHDYGHVQTESKLAESVREFIKSRIVE